LKLKKIFLKRMACPGVSIDDLFIGSVITVYSRQLKLAEYGDLFTRQRFESKRQRTFAMIKPDAYINTGKILDAIYQSGFMISKLKMTRFTPETAGAFYGEHRGKPFYNGLMDFMTTDVVTGLELVAENAVEKWRHTIGPTRTFAAKQSAPNSIRAHFGTDDTKNAVHGSDSGPSWKRETDLFFQSRQPSTAVFNNCTLCIIKPHAVLNGDAGKIIDIILQEGFEISALEMFTIDKPTAEEFFEVYKGVAPEFVAMTEHMTTGPCLVLEVRQENVVKAFRELAGPADPEIAKNLRPHTLRARFGVDKARNAVHCTDLAEDGTLESEYFFSILQKE